MKKHFFLLSILLFFGLSSAHSQDYKSSIGLRTGASSGLTYKHFISSEDAIEGILAWRYRNPGLAGIWERHAQFLDVWGLNWYYGGGAHFFVYDANGRDKFGRDDGGLVIGLDGILGAEYKIKEIPITVSVDLRPGINVFGVFGPIGNEIGISIRYIFSNRVG
jgi:hypothetical protein